MLGWRNVELYFAGKDSLGHVQSANLSDLNGLCIEYSGKFTHLKGLRFVIESMHETEADLEYDFNILSFGHYFYSCFLYINFIYYVT